MSKINIRTQKRSVKTPFGDIEVFDISNPATKAELEDIFSEMGIDEI